MAQTESNPIKPPNETYRGDRRANGWLPTTGHASQVHGSNSQFATGDGDRGMSFPDVKQGSPIQTPNNGVLKFDVHRFKMPDQPAMTRPAEGAIPVIAGRPAGGNPLYTRDGAKPR